MTLVPPTLKACHTSPAQQKSHRGLSLHASDTLQGMKTLLGPCLDLTNPKLSHAQQGAGASPQICHRQMFWSLELQAVDNRTKISLM